MPIYVVKRTTPVLASVTVEAANPHEAREAALAAWLADARNAASLSTPELRIHGRRRTGRRDARAQMGLGGSESPREETEA